MDRKQLEKLFAKYLSGNASTEEKQEVERWYRSFEGHEGFTSKLNDAKKKELENKILSRIDEKIRMFEGETPHRTFSGKRALREFSQDYRMRPFLANSYKIAAVFIGFIVLAIVTYRALIDKTVVHHTAYGKTLNIVLPDSSTVILNGNSTFSYDEDSWGQEGAREVYLDGEAFFSVRHTKSAQKFIVNISDKLSVEVLGTKFNVSNRKSGTRVVLNSGRILLNLKESFRNEHVVMNPGELVELKDNPAGYIKTGYIKKKVNTEIYSAWKNKKLIFDNTSLRQVVVLLEENYGLKSEVFDVGLLEQKVSGTIPAENVEVLLKNISITYGIRILKKDDSIEIRNAQDN